MENTTKITKRSIYEALAAAAKDGVLHIEDFNADLSDIVVAEFCDNEIALLDKKAAKAKETAAKKKAEGDDLTEAVAEALSDKYETIADIAARIEGDDVSAAKVQYRLNALAKAGRAEKTEVSIPATETTKARRVVAYKAAAAVDAE